MKRQTLTHLCTALLLGVIFGVLVGATNSNAKVPVGTLSGTVLDSHGKAVAGASVSIQTSDGLHPNAMLTDKDGRFTFARYKTGEYDLRASSGKAVSGWMKRVMIRSNRTTEVTLRLGPHKR